ncbi:hypothetical protein HIM_11728 [Hirsutella minnesotensis 3608]|uniref:Ecp2 effector protein-like domain-containing protein n=1 Tax=Hirsutella minnesotensis 3608 TaxID=1043627 RepID=A0A0F8A0V2_9HYPO|nr:hypothetical protein HIM_11728 [Hirsutella minnesotensis 3608]
MPPTRLSAALPLAILSLAVSVLAAAMPPMAIGYPFTNATGVVWKPAPAGQGTCGDMTIDASPGLEPADWRQCASLFSSWAEQKGAFSVARPSPNTFLPLVGQRACALSVEPADPTLGPYIIGSNDVEALFKSSLKDHSAGTLLAVNGTIQCDLVSGGRAPLVWKIAKPAQSPS